MRSAICELIRKEAIVGTYSQEIDLIESNLTARFHLTRKSDKFVQNILKPLS